jgi:hypothetical protein
MSLKMDFFEGTSGLLQQCDAAFVAGQAFIGTGAVDIESLFLSNSNGTSLSAGSAQPGVYFNIQGASGVVYRVWFSVNGEVAPPSAGYSLLQVNLLLSDNTIQVAGKIAAALSTLTNDLTVETIGGSIQTTAIAPRSLAPLTLGATGWGTAVASVVQAGVNPTGNYAQISNDLKTQAANGFTTFTLTYLTTYNPAILRGSNAPGNINAPNRNNRVCKPGDVNYNNNVGYNQAQNYTYANTGFNPYTAASNYQNLILKSYLAGIQDGLAQQNIYNFECFPQLDVSDNVNTSIDLNFTFQTM